MYAPDLLFTRTLGTSDLISGGNRFPSAQPLGPPHSGEMDVTTHNRVGGNPTFGGFSGHDNEHFAHEWQLWDPLPVEISDALPSSDLSASSTVPQQQRHPRPRRGRPPKTHQTHLAPAPQPLTGPRGPSSAAWAHVGNGTTAVKVMGTSASCPPPRLVSADEPADSPTDTMSQSELLRQLWAQEALLLQLQQKTAQVRLRVVRSAVLHSTDSASLATPNPLNLASLVQRGT